MGEVMDLDAMADAKSDEEASSVHETDNMDHEKTVSNGGEGDGAAASTEEQVLSPMSDDAHSHSTRDATDQNESSGKPAPSTAPSAPKADIRPTAGNFLRKLRDIVGTHETIKWDLTDGRSFYIYDLLRFSELFMGDEKYKNEFVRKLNGNGFSYRRAGNTLNRVMHPLFQRDRPELLDGLVPRSLQAFLEATAAVHTTPSASAMADGVDPPQVVTSTADGDDTPATAAAHSVKKEVADEESASVAASGKGNASAKKGKKNAGKDAEPTPMDTAETTAAAAAAETALRKTPLPFVKSLRRAVQTDDLWDASGLSFSVPNIDAFATRVFEGAKWNKVQHTTTFLRFQLRIHGFRGQLVRPGRTKEGQTRFRHALFQKDAPELALGITRDESRAPVLARRVSQDTRQNSKTARNTDATQTSRKELTTPKPEPTPAESASSGFKQALVRHNLVNVSLAAATTLESPPRTPTAAAGMSSNNRKSLSSKDDDRKPGIILTPPPPPAAAVKKKGPREQDLARARQLAANLAEARAERDRRARLRSVYDDAGELASLPMRPAKAVVKSLNRAPPASLKGKGKPKAKPAPGAKVTATAAGKMTAASKKVDAGTSMNSDMKAVVAPLVASAAPSPMRLPTTPARATTIADGNAPQPPLSLGGQYRALAHQIADCRGLQFALGQQMLADEAARDALRIRMTDVMSAHVKRQRLERREARRTAILEEVVKEREQIKRATAASMRDSAPASTTVSPARAAAPPRASMNRGGGGATTLADAVKSSVVYTGSPRRSRANPSGAVVSTATTTSNTKDDDNAAGEEDEINEEHEDAPGGTPIGTTPAATSAAQSEAEDSDDDESDDDDRAAADMLMSLSVSVGVPADRDTEREEEPMSLAALFRRPRPSASLLAVPRRGQPPPPLSPPQPIALPPSRGLARKRPATAVPETGSPSLLGKRPASPVANESNNDNTSMEVHPPAKLEPDVTVAPEAKRVRRPSLRAKEAEEKDSDEDSTTPARRFVSARRRA